MNTSAIVMLIFGAVFLYGGLAVCFTIANRAGKKKQSQ
jgi:hypothetical protein